MWLLGKSFSKGRDRMFTDLLKDWGLASKTIKKFIFLERIKAQLFFHLRFNFDGKRNLSHNPDGGRYFIGHKALGVCSGQQRKHVIATLQQKQKPADAILKLNRRDKALGY